MKATKSICVVFGLLGIGSVRCFAFAPTALSLIKLRRTSLSPLSLSTDLSNVNSDDDDDDDDDYDDDDDEYENDDDEIEDQFDNELFNDPGWDAIREKLYEVPVFECVKAGVEPELPFFYTHVEDALAVIDKARKAAPELELDVNIEIHDLGTVFQLWASNKALIVPNKKAIVQAGAPETSTPLESLLFDDFHVPVFLSTEIWQENEDGKRIYPIFLDPEDAVEALEQAIAADWENEPELAQVVDTDEENESELAQVVDTDEENEPELAEVVDTDEENEPELADGENRPQFEFVVLPLPEAVQLLADAQKEDDAIYEFVLPSSSIQYIRDVLSE
jgi:hypothetical protein